MEGSPAILWDSVPLRTENGKILLLELRFGDGRNLLAGRLDSDEGWESLAEGIRGEPAEDFRLESVGIPEKGTVTYASRTLPNRDMRAWIKMRISKARERTGSERIPLPVDTVEAHPGKWVLMWKG